jgi:lysozyme family protein
MTESNFALSLPWTLAHEGGWSNHPKDPGGATMRGVTQRVYTGFRSRKGLPNQSVRFITPEEIHDIYKFQYWDALRCDDLPAGIDYAVFDFGVNSGVSRAARYLQRVLGVKQDGIIGVNTIRAANEADPAFVVQKLCELRMQFLRGLKTWKTFGRGWTRRVMGEIEGTQNDDTGVVDRANFLVVGFVKTIEQAEAIAPKAAAPGKGMEEERESSGESSIIRANALQIATAGGVGVQTFFSSLEGIERTIFLGFAGVVILLAFFTIRKRVQAWADGWR